MTNYVLSIDPGWSSGAALLRVWNDKPAALIKAWQFTGGLAAFSRWIKEVWREAGWDHYNDERQDAGFRGWIAGNDFRGMLYAETRWVWNGEDEEKVGPDLTVIAEKFTPRPNDKFGLTLRSVEPLRCEGILVDRGLLPDYENTVKEWRDPKYQYVVGGKDLSDKKKRLHTFLKDSGYYVTNKMFSDSPSKDGADDARSAIGHGLAYIVREMKNKPTFELMSDWSEKHGS